MDDTVEVIRSNKGGMKIIHKGYMYTVHKTRRGGGIRWRCTQRGFYCKGSISTGNGRPKVNMPHNHIPDPLSVAIARAKHSDEVISGFDSDLEADMADDWTDPSYSPYVMPTSNNGGGGAAATTGGTTTRARRKSNFTQAEVNVLRKMMRRYAKHLKGRVTNTDDVMERRKIWTRIVDAVNSVSVEERTMLEIKSKWKKCRYEDELCERNGVCTNKNMSVPVLNVSDYNFTPISTTQRVHGNYDLDFKKKVILAAEKTSNREAEKVFGVSESNIRRWRKLKGEIFGFAPLIRSDQRRMRRVIHLKGRLPTGSQIIGGKTVTKSIVVNNIKSTSTKKSPSDAMPLQQRLTTSSAQQPKIENSAVPAAELKSQPLSPTKLKVTRQSNQQSQFGASKKPEATPVPQSMQQAEEEVCLRWNSHHSNMQTSFPDLLQKEQYVDVTLASEGKILKCHKLILSSCSGYFDEILSSVGPNQHPIIFLKDIPFWILRSLCDFMYAGEVHIDQNNLEELLHIAEVLKIKGLGRRPGPLDQPAPSPTPSTPTPTPTPTPGKIKPKQEKRDSTSPPPHHHQQQQPQQFISNKPQTRLSHTKTTPILTRSQLHQQQQQQQQRPSTASSAATIEPVDPLKLLKPKLVYERMPTFKTRERVILKKMPMKKMKRKRSPERDSPIPMVQYRRGTRSRPQVKIPKQYHDDYEDVIQQEQQQQQLLAPSPPPTVEPIEDPLIPIEIIKTEPIDVVENDISSFSIMETDEPPSFTDPIADDGPPILVAQEMVNPLAEADEEPQQQREQQQLPIDDHDGFLPIRLSAAEHDKTTVEDTVASIQIAECHSMNLDEQEEENRMIDQVDEQEEENRMIDQGVETLVTNDLIKTDEDDTIHTQTTSVVEEVDEKIDIELKEEEEESVVENHVTEMLEVQKSDGGTEPVENDVQ